MASSPITRLSDLCTMVVDCPHSTPVWTDSGYVVLRNQNIKGGRLDLSTPSFTDADHFAQRVRRAKPQKGDIVITREAPMGEVCMIPEGLECCLGQRQVLLRPDSRKTTPRYLLYALQSRSVQDQIAWNEGTGSTVSNIRIPVLESLKIPTPPLTDQQEIAGTLGALDDKITLLRETNATLEAIAQAIFKSWFVDFDPVRAKAEGRDPEGVPPEVADFFPSEFEDSELGAIPKGWRSCLLDEACEVNPARRLQKGVDAPYLEMSALTTNGHRPETPVTRAFSSGTKFRDGDSLLARITPCLENGKTAFVDFLGEDVVGWGSTEFIVLHPKAPLPPYWGYLLCRHEPFRQFAIQAMAGTSGRQRVDVSRLVHFRVAMPPVSIGRAFAGVVEPIQKRIAANDEQAKSLAALRDTLLPRLMSGKLHISVVEEVLA